MSWTYSGNPSSGILDRYRFLIGDTIQSDPVLQDEEIMFLVNKNNSEVITVVDLLEAILNTFARDYKRSLGPQSEDPSSRSEYFERKLDRYRRLATGYGTPSATTATAIFTKGMHDNV